MDVLMQMLSSSFLLYALCGALLVALSCGFLGPFVVLKRQSLLSDTLAHASLLGATVGGIMSLDPLLPSLFTSIAAALFIELLRRQKGMPADAVLAVVIAMSLALSALIAQLYGSFGARFVGLLFGSVASVGKEELLYAAVLGVVLFTILGFMWREYVYITLDEECAQAAGLRVKLLGFVFALLCAVAVGIAARIVGALMVSALLVIPALSALRLSVGFKQTVLLSTIFAVSASFCGTLLSYYASIPTGAAVVTISVLIFFASFFFGRFGSAAIK